MDNARDGEVLRSEGRGLGGRWGFDGAHMRVTEATEGGRLPTFLVYGREHEWKQPAAGREWSMRAGLHRAHRCVIAIVTTRPVKLWGRTYVAWLDACDPQDAAVVDALAEAPEIRLVCLGPGEERRACVRLPNPLRWWPQYLRRAVAEYRPWVAEDMAAAQERYLAETVARATAHPSTLSSRRRVRPMSGEAVAPVDRSEADGT